MTTAIAERIRLTDLAPNMGDARAEFLAGLRHAPKRIAPKFFYDERGSRLFERICELDEYYLTRTETLILRENLSAIIRACGSRCLLVELGSGSSTKTRLLLENLADLIGYVPIDISRSHLINTAERLAGGHKLIEILPVCADYAKPLRLPRSTRTPNRTVLFFPGSTIGNFEPAEAAAFLRSVAGWCLPGDRMLVGVDLIKDPHVLHAAYNDQMGVTAEFNLNLLRRANREFSATFDVGAFEHEAIYNAPQRRIEMRLVSRRDQIVRVAGAPISFERGERTTTEYSCKYSLTEFAIMAGQGGWRVCEHWTDRQGWFGMFALRLD